MIRRRLSVLFHVSGLSCLGSALVLQLLVFSDILQYGVFVGAEGDPLVLCCELGLSVFALVYFMFLYLRFLRSWRGKI